MKLEPRSNRARAAGLLCLAGCFGMAAAASAQPVQKPAEATETAKSKEVMIFALKYTRADDVLRVLRSVFLMNAREPVYSFAADERANSIIISAPAAELAKIKEVIARIDMPGAEGVGARALQVIRLDSLEPDRALEEALKMVFQNSGNGNFSVDRQRRLVIMSADDPTFRAAAELLKRMEDQDRRPSADVQLRVVWLINGLEREDAPAPAGDLKELLPGLAKLGIERPRVAGQLMVNVTTNAQFQAKGLASFKTDIPCQFSIKGRLSDKKAIPSLEITLLANQNRGPGVEEICNLHTEISAPLGHLVVLGITPTGTTTSVFVIQVLTNEQAFPKEKKPAPKLP